MAWQDWEDQGRAELWKTVLDCLEMQIRGFVGRAGIGSSAKVTKALWDQPNVELRWHSEDVWRNVNVEIVSDTWPLALCLSGSVWRDVAKPKDVEREFKPLLMDTVTFENFQELDRGFERDLSVAFDNVSRLTLTFTATGARFAD